jgi:hypothetical protein
MNRSRQKLTLLLGIVLSGAWLSTANAQATRTWVSGVGDDANPCSRTAPCKTFAGAISKTAPGGEIDVLDPGGFGVVTITKSLTLDGTGSFGSVLSSSVNGIIINAAPTDKVIIRGLSINGAGTGLSGIRFIAGGALYVERCIIQHVGAGGGTNSGIDFEPGNANSKLEVSHTSVMQNAGHGILVKPTVGMATTASIVDCVIQGNTLTGLRIEDNVTLSVKRTTSSGNNNGFVATSTTNPSFLNVDDCQATDNIVGGVVAGFGSAGATIRVGRSMVTGNGFGLRLGSGGVIISWGDNHVSGNGVDGLPSSTILPE